MQIVSPVYKGKINLCGEIVDFKNGNAEVSDELYKKIVDSGFPNVFKKGEFKGVKSKERDDFDKSIKELNEEYMDEIDRLKGIVSAKEQTIKELQQEVVNWKTAYSEETNSLKKQLLAAKESVIAEQKKAEEPAPEEELLSDEEAVRKDLEAMKLDELRVLAEKEGLDPKEFKSLTKKELIDAIMGIGK